MHLSLDTHFAVADYFNLSGFPCGVGLKLGLAGSCLFFSVVPERCGGKNPEVGVRKLRVQILAQTFTTCVTIGKSWCTKSSGCRIRETVSLHDFISLGLRILIVK